MALSDEVCEAFWSAASREEIGIKFRIRLEDVRAIEGDLYDWRKRNGGFQNISIVLPQGGEYLFMIKKTVELD